MQADERNAPLSERDPYNGSPKSSLLSFHRLLPVPKEIVSRPYDSPGGAYEWQKQNWGVKWGACHSECEAAEELVYLFDTAWVAPTQFVQNVSQRYPELKFHLCSACTGIGWNECKTFQNGAAIDEW